MVRGGAKPLRTWPFRHEGDAVSGDGRGDLGGAGMGSCGIDLPLPNRAWGVSVGTQGLKVLRNAILAQEAM